MKVNTLELHQYRQAVALEACMDTRMKLVEVLDAYRGIADNVRASGLKVRTPRLACFVKSNRTRRDTLIEVDAVARLFMLRGHNVIMLF